MYDKITCRIRNGDLDKVEVAKHYSGRYGAPGMPRAEKKNRTPEEMARQNHWRRCRDLRRLLELNFSPGDWHVILTCRKEERPEKEEAKAVIRKFLSRLRGAYRQQGWELRYVITCEIGKRGAVHWHMVLNNEHSEKKDTAGLIRELWERGRVYFSALEAVESYGKLAEYLAKEAARRIENGETLEKLSYSCSRNLRRPVEKRERIKAAAWSRVPRIPKGWELEPGSLINGINRYTGLPYQRYTLRRKEVEGSGRKHIHKHQYPRSSP